MNISLDHLLILDAIERCGSFSAAAASVHRVPSALSHAVAKLERDLGVALFVRQGRQACLTEAGLTLLRDGRHLLMAAADLERRVQRIATGWESELRIAIDQVIPVQRLYPLLALFYASGQPTRISLSSEVLAGGWDALITGRADLVIGAPGERPVHSGMASRPLVLVHMAFMVAPDHPLAALPGPLTPEQVRQYRAVVIADTSRELVARSSGLLEGQEILRVPDMAAKAAAQAAGLGVGHLPLWLAAQEMAAGRLIERVLAEPTPPLMAHLAWRSRQAGKALAWFLEVLAEPNVLAGLSKGLVPEQD